ncbi:hypothetical protein APA386B_7P2 (plasmid) [Acetobacter pasteurianus 386B]|nr:hypothetical protein APA386B_7P2 [Acetobacter pasteurianus 386B]
MPRVLWRQNDPGQFSRQERTNEQYWGRLREGAKSGSVAKLVPLFETAFSFGVRHCGWVISRDGISGVR